MVINHSHSWNMTMPGEFNVNKQTWTSEQFYMPLNLAGKTKITP